jgi:hypothetical protein
MNSKAPKPASPKSHARGRALVAVAIATAVSLAVTGVAGRPLALVLRQDRATFTATALLLALSWYLWRGDGWARWTGALVALGGGCLSLVLVIPRLDTLRGLMVVALIGLGLLCLAHAWALSCSADVRAFLSAQRQCRRTPGDEERPSGPAA